MIKTQGQDGDQVVRLLGAMSDRKELTESIDTHTEAVSHLASAINNLADAIEKLAGR